MTLILFGIVTMGAKTRQCVFNVVLCSSHIAIHRLTLRARSRAILSRNLGQRSSSVLAPCVIGT